MFWFPPQSENMYSGVNNQPVPSKDLEDLDLVPLLLSRGRAGMQIFTLHSCVYVTELKDLLKKFSRAAKKMFKTNQCAEGENGDKQKYVKQTKRRREEKSRQIARKEVGRRREENHRGVKNNQRYFWTRRLVFVSQLSLLNLTHSSGGALFCLP